MLLIRLATVWFGSRMFGVAMGALGKKKVTILGCFSDFLCIKCHVLIIQTFINMKIWSSQMVYLLINLLIWTFGFMCHIVCHTQAFPSMNQSTTWPPPTVLCEPKTIPMHIHSHLRYDIHCRVKVAHPHSILSSLSSRNVFYYSLSLYLFFGGNMATSQMNSLYGTKHTAENGTSVNPISKCC